MKRFLKTATVITALTLFCASGFASGTLYVYYDAACMDRLEYASQADQTGGKFIVYQVNTSNSDKITLAVGYENPNPVAQMPAQVLHCGNTIFDQRFVQVVNQQISEVILVRASGDGRYYFSKVAYSTYYSNSSGALMYQSPKFQFAFQTGTGVIGENISLNKSASIVQFEGRIENSCSGEYIFSMSGLTGGPYANMVIVPEIGVVEERSGANTDEAMRNILRLEKVNDRPVAEYLRIICRGERPVPVSSAGSATTTLTPRSGEIPVSAETVVPVILPSSSTSGTVAVIGTPAAVQDPCGEAAASGYHLVHKGENLYRISQMYQVSVGQLREWNNLNAATTIYPCQKLRVAASAAPVGTPPSYSAEQLTAKGVGETPVWKTYAGLHIVQPGETIASIAMKYGYTEYRFRYLNQLAANDVAKVGQSLKTTDCDCPAISSGQTTQQVPPSYESVLTPRSPVSSGDQFSTTGGRIRSVGTAIQAESAETELTSNSWRSSVGNSSTSSIPPSYGTEGSTGQVSSNLVSRMAPAYDSTLPQNYESGTIRRTTHLVGNNETLFDIARRYNTTTENLRRLNNLNPGEAIIPGLRLFVN